MLILPAIDLRGGRCVRLVQGRAENETVYSENPVDVALAWKKSGARMLHIADLDGAFSGRPVHVAMAKKMKEATGLPVQIGGGYRDLPSIEQAAACGLDRVILGTVAVGNPELVSAAVQRFGRLIAVSIDVSGDFVAVSGWTKVSAVRFEALAEDMVERGVTQLLFTDTRKDGTLSGPNIPAIRRFLKAARAPVFASGGVSSIEDVRALQPLAQEGLSGVVIGKALYDRTLTLEDAILVAGPQG